MATAANTRPKPDAKALPVYASVEEAVKRTRELAPQIAKRSDQAEAGRMQPAENIRDLTESGLFALTTPKTYGGSGLGPVAMVEIASELASFCGSTGWVYGVLSGHNWMLAKFSPQAQADVFANPRSLTGTVFRMAGKVTPVDGGYRMVEGQGRFCSGIDYCDWVILGNAVQNPDGTGEPAFFLLQRSDIEIVDDWYTAGMRGTGSKSIRVKDAFIPAHRMLPVADISRGDTEGARLHGGSYLLPFPAGIPFSLVGAPLGMAAGIVEMFGAFLAKKLQGASPEQIAEQTGMLQRLSMAAAEADAARDIVLQHARAIEAARNFAELPEVARARIFRDIAFAAQKCRQVGNSLFEATGGSGIYDSSPLQRMWRDVNSVTAHTAFAWDAASVGYARALIGLPPVKNARR